MKIKFIPFFVIFVFLVFFIIFFRGLNDTNIYTPENNTQYEIPEFKVKEFYSSVSLSSSEIFELNKIYLLNIWSSWCVPCRQEHSLLMKLNEDEKISIIGMNYKDNKKNAENFLKELGNPYKEIFVDLDGTIAIEWGAYGVPESFLIYKNKIIKKYRGPLTQKQINEMEKILK
tara:strand:+ start:1029 stop:1547 length:519 start_codon:yes stop_codon:yes gene_type:complete